MKVTKFLILILVCISLLGCNNNDILDDNNPKWNIDTDGDNLPDAMEEIIGTDVNKKDSNGNYINDGDELNPDYRYKLNDNYINEKYYKTNSVDVNDYTLLKSASMASEKIHENSIGKSVKEVFGDKYEELKDFIIVRYENGDKGFGGIALRNDNNIIISYKPTRNYKEWVENFTTQFMPHPQRKYAIEFIEPIINKNDNIYISGHSLGGLLSQYVTYYLNNEDYNNIKTVTFNSANILNPKHMKGQYGPPIIKENLKEQYKEVYLNIIPKKGENLTINNSYLVKLLNESIQDNGFIDVDKDIFKNSDFIDYKEIVTNYIISNDPLYIIINGGYLGDKKIIEVEEENLDIVQDRDKLSKYHELENFIDILK
ncbi:MAG: Mbeg1-like protein [Paraclostridium sp.]